MTQRALEAGHGVQHVRLRQPTGVGGVEGAHVAGIGLQLGQNVRPIAIHDGGIVDGGRGFPLRACGSRRPSGSAEFNATLKTVGVLRRCRPPVRVGGRDTPSPPPWLSRWQVAQEKDVVTRQARVVKQLLTEGDLRTASSSVVRGIGTIGSLSQDPAGGKGVSAFGAGAVQAKVQRHDGKRDSHDN